MLRIEFKGNHIGQFSAQFAMEPFDGNLDAVFDTINRVLWFNLDDNTQLDDNDLSIVLSGVGTLQGSDVYDGSILFG